MADRSDLDARYFIDGSVYNCPFCNRRNVVYAVTGTERFDWTDSKECYAYFVWCRSCAKASMHLSHESLEVEGTKFAGRWADGELDSKFFYSVPTSFFALDERIPRVLRELLTEAEGALKSNFLTGASACARKVIYELAKREDAEGDNYEDRIKSLKRKHPEVDPYYFDSLVTIQEATSSKVHEEAYDGWESKHLRLILAALSSALHEIYVVPALQRDRRDQLARLRDEVLGGKTEQTDPPEREGSEGS